MRAPPSVCPTPPSALSTPRSRGARSANLMSGIENYRGFLLFRAFVRPPRRMRPGRPPTLPIARTGPGVAHMSMVAPPTSPTGATLLLQEEMGAFKMHRTKCTAVITSVLAPHFREELKEDVGESPYSLYLDETTDTSVNKLLCICVKYRSQKHNKFVSTYLGLVDLLSADAQGISDAIVSFLSECGLDIKHMVGIATDGASVMVGKHHSVFTLLKQKQPSLQLIRCICHSLDIVAHKAMQLLPSNVEYMIRETYNWFAHSAKRQSDYNSVYKTINDGHCPLKFISPSSTRWLVMSDCIEHEDALKLHFGLVSSAEHCSQDFERHVQ
ncbi:SCAN domain-containing protein 3 [Larimichthys crocea]|uniref:SCAN domain-containing protein 3 n=1 Tax=Larimichthys crocea TaxID=215358 RepID=A0A6G0IRI3_LARCR|nr:SCAN domain-containing protein 3 [Larimichthys crocea]